MSNHSQIGPSSAHRWSKCPASVKASEGMPGNESDAAREGTAAHWCAEQMFEGNTDTIDKSAPNGVTITDEMWEGAREFYNEVFRTVNGYAPDVTMGHVQIEQRVDISIISDGVFGTCDAWVVTDKILQVWDFKFGRRPVEARNNLQLICYALGILDNLTIDVDHVQLHIVQPRAWHHRGPVRSYMATTSEILAYLPQLQEAAQRAIKGDGQFSTGDWCRYCRASIKCSAYRASSYNAVDVIDTVEPIELDDFALGLEIAMLRDAQSRIKDRLNSLEAEAVEKIRTGASVNGFALGNGRSSTAWTVENEDIYSIGELMGIDLRQDKPVTPLQAIKKGVDETVIKQYSKKIPGAVKLIPDDETIAARVFKSN